MRNAQQLSSCWLHCAPPRLSGAGAGSSSRGKAKYVRNPVSSQLPPGGSYTCK